MFKNTTITYRFKQETRQKSQRQYKDRLHFNYIWQKKTSMFYSLVSKSDNPYYVSPKTNWKNINFTQKHMEHNHRNTLMQLVQITSRSLTKGELKPDCMSERDTVGVINNVFRTSLYIACIVTDSRWLGNYKNSSIRFSFKLVMQDVYWLRYGNWVW